MRTPLDTPKRREALRSSPELAAVKHLARAQKVRMRRVRRLGPVRYALGARDGRVDYGEVLLTDSGSLQATRLFGEQTDSLLEIGRLLEYGPHRDLKPSVPLGSSYSVGTIPVVEATETGTVDIVIPVIITPPPMRRQRSIAEKQARALASVKTLPQIWTRFVGGLVLTAQPLVAVLWVINGYGVFLSVIGALAGLGLVKHSIRANDIRYEKLHAVGLVGYS